MTLLIHDGMGRPLASSSTASSAFTFASTEPGDMYAELHKNWLVSTINVLAVMDLGEVYQVATTGELVQVTSISPTHATVTRGYGGTAQGADGGSHIRCVNSPTCVPMHYGRPCYWCQMNFKPDKSGDCKICGGPPR